MRRSLGGQDGVVFYTAFVCKVSNRHLSRRGWFGSLNHSGSGGPELKMTQSLWVGGQCDRQNGVFAAVELLGVSHTG